MEANSLLITNFTTTLAGPGRKKLPRTYFYQLIFCDPDANTDGCLALWEVSGGDQTYQIAFEREESGALRMHCTCADSAYRGETVGHVCKHVRGLLDLNRPGRSLPQVAAA